jgi:hypothetical protein
MSADFILVAAVTARAVESVGIARREQMRNIFYNNKTRISIDILVAQRI